MSQEQEHNGIVVRNLQTEMEESYIRYGMSVIISRALPDVRDGLKPSQRRILYAMRQLNLSPGGKHRKCAKICGDTSGDFHPHGESVIYPTLARMAQPWVMRYKLIDGQGNFGSVDGDPPAAMRYTEARLTQSSVALMEDLDKDTVDHIQNYDETKMEPTVFPAKYPNMLAMGSSGIAVGMATNIPPHNMGELIQATKLVIDDPDVTIDEIMEVMPAPDFPTGGVICGLSGVKEAYHTGRGKVILRAITEVEDINDKGGRQQIVVNELPYNVNKAELIISVANLIKDDRIKGISDVRDESDKDGMRIVFELKRNEIPDVTINQLFKFTNMQVTFGCNMLALDKGLPKCMNIKQFITCWIEHRIEVVTRRTRFELAKAEARAHILEGYIVALNNLDQLVKMIKESQSKEDAKVKIIDAFGFSERQATAVLEMRLHQLTGLEREKIENELSELNKLIEYLKSILASDDEKRRVIKEELDEILKLKPHLSDRRTKMVAAEGEFNAEDLIPDVRVVVTVSDEDYIKRMPEDTFREQRRGGAGVKGKSMKEGDTLKCVYTANNHDYLLIYTNLGRCYWLKVWQLVEGGRQTKGRPLVNYLSDLQEGEKVAAILPVREFEEEACVLHVTKNGVVKKTQIAEYSNVRRKGVAAIKIDEDDEVISARLVHEGEQIMLFTRNGMAVRFNENQVRCMGRVSRGVRGVTLKGKEDRVIAVEIVKPEHQLLIVCENGYGKRSRVDAFRETKRGAGGVKSIIVNKRNGHVVFACSVTDEDSVLLMSKEGQTIRMPLDEVRVMSRSTQGVCLVKLSNPNDVLAAGEKITAQLKEDGEEENT